MPRKAKKRSVVRKPRTRKRRFKKTIRRVKRVRRTKRKAKWFKKWSGRKFIYHFPSSIGLKWSQYLSLSDFMCLPHCSWINSALMAASDHNTRYIKGGHVWDPQYITDSQNFLTAFTRMFSTERMRSNLRTEDIGADETDYKWWGWNPFLCANTCGSWISNYLNMYKQYKYVGVQVKWIPNAKFSTAYWEAFIDQKKIPTALEPGIYNNITLAEGTGGMLLDLSSQTRPGFLEKPEWVTDNQYDYDSTVFSGWKIPPTVRMWVNFNKQGYVNYDGFHEKVINAATVAQNNNVIRDHRVLIRNVYDSYGQRMDAGKIRCFNLSKRFKFYVRPKIVRPVKEMPDGDNPARDIQVSTSLYQIGLTQKLPNSDETVTGLKRYPWSQLNYLFPYYANYQDTYSNDVITGDNLNNNIVVNMIDRYFVDPNLFGYLFTIDGLDANRCVYPFSVEMTDRTTRQRYSAFAWKLCPLDFLRDMGRFKVTFYVKFRGACGRRYVPYPQQFYQNAQGGNAVFGDGTVITT